MIFAWSFDGVIPTRFSKLSEKRGSPNNAVILVSVIVIIYVLATVYFSNILTVLAYSTSGIYFAISIAGIAAMLFPYRRKDLFQQAPPSVQRKIGGIPVISLLGFGTLATGIFVGYTAASPAFTGSPINPIYVSVIGLTFLVGLLIYLVSYFYQKGKGFDITMRFKEIPPE
jgi:amino acid transporter